MFLVDTAQGRIIADEEIKSTLAAAKPYKEWLDAGILAPRRPARTRRRRPRQRRGGVGRGGGVGAAGAAKPPAATSTPRFSPAS